MMCSGVSVRVSGKERLDTEILYETTPKWHGFLMIKLAASAAGLNSEPQNIEFRRMEALCAVFL
jgi:hypothetical protein